MIREVLSEEEINTLTNKTFATSCLSVIRDLFLFSCYTGLAYADVKKLKRHEITTGMDGAKWIFIQRKKADALLHIPLLSAALKILEKYEDDPMCVNKGVVLPVPSNQKMNDYLKEIADLCSITKNMTFHTARHTLPPPSRFQMAYPLKRWARCWGTEI